MSTSENNTPENPGPDRAALPPPTVRVLLAAEHAIEDAALRAQVSLARRLGARGRRVAGATARLLGALALVAYFAGGGAILALRYYVLPRIDDWRPAIEQAAGQALHARVHVGRIEADWQGLRPRLLLWDLALQDEQGSPVLALPQVDAVVGWLTAATWQPHLYSLAIEAPEVEVRRLADGRIRVAGMVLDPRGQDAGSAFLDWLLAQKRITVRDAHLRFIDEASPPRGDGSEGPPAPLELEFADVNLRLERGFTDHRFALQLLPPADLAGPVDLRGAFSTPWSSPSSRISDWSGRIFAQVQDVDLARLDSIAQMAPPGVAIRHAVGRTRAWTDFSSLRPGRVRIDFSLRDVDATLRPDLSPLQLDSVRGRFTHSTWSDSGGEGREFALEGLAFEGPGIAALAPTDVALRLTQPHDAAGAALAPATRLTASRLVLSDLSRMATRVPLPPEWIRLIERTAAHGSIEDLTASWEGNAAQPANVALKARFRSLGAMLDRALIASRHAADTNQDLAAAAAAKPGADGAGPAEGIVAGFDNLSGQVEFDARRGLLRLEPGSARLTLPGLFDSPDLALDRLAALLSWNFASDGALQLQVESASAANADFDLEGTGSWRRAGARPALAQANVRIARASVPAMRRYVPQAADPALRRWLAGALIEGEVTEGRVTLQGDPQRIPFADPANGDLQVELNIGSGQLDYAPLSRDSAGRGGWPALSGIDARLRIQRNELRIDGRRAFAFGYELDDVVVRIAGLDRPNQHLLVDGTGTGPLPQMLRYLGESPLNARTGGWLSGAQGAGPARLRLHLDVPLEHAVDTTAEGQVQFQNDELTLRPDISTFTDLSGKLEFTHRGIRIPAVRATWLGGEVRIDAETRADGAVVMQAQGTATPQGTRRQVALAPVRRMLDHARGLAHYRATIAIHRASTDLTVDSDLAGMAIDLPEPLRKAAAETRPLHYEDNTVPGSAPLRHRMRLALGGEVSLDLERTEVPAPAGAPAGAPPELRIDRGVLAIGTPVGAPAAGMLLSFDQPRLDLDRWIRVLGAPALDPEESAAPAGAAAPPEPGGLAAELSALDFLTVRVGELSIDGKSITNVLLGATRTPEAGWLANLDSDQATGSVQWIAQRGSPGRVAARLARLAIPEREKSQVAAILDAPPADLPALDIEADQFELGSVKLGRLEVDARNAPGGKGDAWQLAKLSIVNPDGHFAGSGQWQRDASGGRTMSLHFTLGIVNSGGLLARMNSPGLLRNAAGKLEGDVSWSGTPFAIDYPSLSGRVHLQTEKGQFLKRDAGAGGRLLGVLSLQSIAHRITGDFRDVFAEGFAFDSIAADAAIASGKLSTSNFIMQGVNAKVRIEGTVDLQQETQELHVFVLPNVNIGGAAIVTAFINPAVGLTALLADLILRQPISAGLADDYEVTGTWADPKVKQVERAPPQAKASPR